MKRTDITELFPEASKEDIDKLMSINGVDVNAAKAEADTKVKTEAETAMQNAVSAAVTDAMAAAATKAAEEKAKAEAEAKAAAAKAKAEAEAAANPTISGYIEPLGPRATANASHVLYDSFAGGKKPICFLASHRIELSQWNHAFVTIHGKKQTLQGWTLPVIEVRSIIKKSDNN